MRIHAFIVVLVAVACSVQARAGASEADAVNLVIADSFPAAHYIHAAVVHPFIRKAEALAEGKLQLHLEPRAATDREMLGRVKRGTFDLGLVTPSIEEGRFPLSAVAELPGIGGDPCGPIRALVQLTREGQPIYLADFEPNGVVPIVRIILKHYPVLLARGVELRRADDFSGLRLRTGTQAMAMTMRALGARPVPLHPPEITPAVRSGALDGAVLPYRTALDYNMLEWAGSSLGGQSFGAIVLTFSISKSRWMALSAGMRAALTEAGEWASVEGCENLERVFMAGEKEIEARGLKLRALPDSDLAFVKARFIEVQQSWRASTDSRGLPGSAVLEAFKSVAQTPRDPR